MATQPPSIHTLTTWQDAFHSYPLPTIRALERDLRKNIDENRTKLRSLVGASYRDLLGTAERIIEMDQQMSELEKGMGEMGRRCDARSLERVGANWQGMKREGGGMGAGEREEMARMAQVKVLRGCLTVVGRVVKGKGDALLGAKVFVLARLLAKGLSESGQASPVLEELKKKLVGLRKRLLGFIERSLTRPGVEKMALAGTLCAYALVTSSTPQEVVRNFLQVRFRQLESKADAPEEEDVMESLELYSQTLLDTKDLFPRRFADALSQLAKVPLLRDAQVYACHELSLDIYGQWIAEDVRNFTPWVRHEQVTSTEVSDALASWTKQAHECLLGGIEEYLKKQDDLTAVVRSRHTIVSKYMALSSRIRSNDYSKSIDDVRATFLRRMKALAIASAALDDLHLDIDDSGGAQLTKKDTLWDLAKDNLDISSGAHAFRRSIIQRRHGRDSALNTEIAKLDSWVERIKHSLESIEHARTRKWDDDLEFDIDDLEAGEELQESLSKSDPKEMMESLSKAVERSVSNSFAAIQGSGESTTAPAHVLRVWRELDVRVRSLQGRLTFSPAPVLLQALHRNISLATSQKAIEEYLDASRGAAHVATTLWDGTPPLPVQPAPTTFKFLSALHREMSAAGEDLWSEETVRELREVVDEQLGTGFSTRTNSTENGSSDLTNGHAEDGEQAASIEGQETKTSGQNRSLQHLFDQLYLQQIFRPASTAPSDSTSAAGLAQSISRLQQHAEVDSAAQQRLEKSAKEYWRRTYLLFGLLAGRARD